MLTYTELMTKDSYEDRLRYLRTDGTPSEVTFGPLRKLNQRFYNSSVWRAARDAVIARDLGYDLAIPGRPIFGKVIVHHMNPLSPSDLVHSWDVALNPEFLITVSNDTHLGIHFGYEPEIAFGTERFAGDTKLW